MTVAVSDAVFLSVDLTIDDDGRPWLIEVNGSNSGFAGFADCYGAGWIERRIDEAFGRLFGDRPVLIVDRLVNTGRLPGGYLLKGLQDLLYFDVFQADRPEISPNHPLRYWRQMRSTGPAPQRPSHDQLKALAGKGSRFQRVMMDVEDPSRFWPSERFQEAPGAGRLRSTEGRSSPITRSDEALIWFRCPTPVFSEQPAGTVLNPAFPLGSLVDNKLFLDRALAAAPIARPRSAIFGAQRADTAGLGALLTETSSREFILKPLLGSQGRGIEIFDLEQLEAILSGREPPVHYVDYDVEIEQLGMLLAAWAFSFTVVQIGELRLSRLIRSRATGSFHHGCLRSLALARRRGEAVEVEWIGAYWRLAPASFDAGAPAHRRYVANQAQGAHAEPVTDEDGRICELFTNTVVGAVVAAAGQLPTTRDRFVAWETDFWVNELKRIAPHPIADRIDYELGRARVRAHTVQEQLESRGFLERPEVALAVDQISRSRYPYLIEAAP